jgi:hydrogenase large subunit
MGIWDDPEAYDASYANADVWGARRLSTPGVVVDGELRTTRLNQVNTGVEEFVDHSFYGDWTDGLEPSTAPDGSPLSPYHPWNKRTIPRPEKRSWKDRYSWATAPRWDREPMEAGPLARQWITATAGLVQTDFIRSGGGELEVHVPGGALPDTVVRWQVPGVSNALERNRARATHVAYCLMVAYSCLLQGFDLVRDGETAMSTPFEVSDGIGVGYWEGGRGALTHHCKVEDGKLSGYQIVTPSTWMASPRDAWGTPGPYEEAVLNTPILEETGIGKDLMGIDVLRSIRSFDPCLPCAVHVHSGDATFVRDATTCACGQE